MHEPVIIDLTDDESIEMSLLEERGTGQSLTKEEADKQFGPGYSKRKLNAMMGRPIDEGVPQIKDSGQRMQFASGMQRDTSDDKIDYSLVQDGPLFERWARHLTSGARKYNKRNWMQANGQEELDRFRESAWRHFVQAMRGDTDEDHFAACVFNLNGILYVQERMKDV